MRNAVLLTCLALAGLASGCFERTLVITLNPDGSGKFVMDNIAAPMPDFSTGPDAKAPDPKQLARKAVRELVDETKGVDAWADVSSEVMDDGRIHVKATGYFPDVNKLEFQGSSKSDVKWAKNASGGMTLEMLMDTKKEGPASKPKPMTDEQVAEAVKKAKMQWQQAQPMMAAFVGKMKIDTTYMLPGKLGQVEGFTKTDKGGVQIVMDGKKMLDAMDKVLADDKMVAEMVKAGRDPVKDGPGEKAMLEAVFGKNVTALKASVTGELKPQFDYKADMGKAKAAQEEMMKKFADAPATK
ncbi:MAG: hypothetical protein ACE15C_17705 [Phycisphaerae bacterium]